MTFKNLENIRKIKAVDGTIVQEIITEKDGLPYSKAYMRVGVGGRADEHRLTSTEEYYVVQGVGKIHAGNKTKVLRAGSTFVVKPRTPQWIENVGEAELQCVLTVSPPWNIEQELDSKTLAARKRP